MTTTVTRVPLLDLKAQYAPIRDEILAKITEVCDNQRFIGGPEVEGLERELAAMLGVKAAVGMSSGTDALLAALMALDIGPGDEVITTTYSFFATAGAIWRLGATPVLVDIDPVTYNIHPDGVARAISRRTRAIIPVHLYGQSGDMEPLMKIAADSNIPVIEDAAQAIGAKYKGQCVGGFGAIGCFSFFPSKNLGAFGDGGLVTTQDEEVAQKLRVIRNHGEEERYHHKLVGANFRLDALQAAVLRIKARHLSNWTEARRHNAARYKKMFREAGMDAGTKSTNRAIDVPAVSLPVEMSDCYHIYNQFIIRVHGASMGQSNRDRLKAFLDARGIGNAIYYPVPFHMQECFASLGYREGTFPHAERAAAETLALPIYGELTEEQQRHVVETVAEGLRG